MRPAYSRHAGLRQIADFGLRPALHQAFGFWRQGTDSQTDTMATGSEDEALFLTRTRTPMSRLTAKISIESGDAELLSYLLAGTTRGRAPIVIARELLDRAGGLRPLLARPAAAAAQTAGVGPASGMRLAAAVELGRRYLGGELAPRRRLGSPADAAGFLRARLADLGHEVFACLFLDTRHRIIRFEPLFRGTLDGAAVYPREVVKRSLELNAGALILAHNHPSGDAEPSEADRAITDRLSRALALVEIRLLDHFVVSASGHVSLAERGWI